MQVQPKSRKSAKPSAPAQPKVEPMQRVHANSRPTRIAELAIGESESISIRVLFNDCTKERMSDELDRIRSTMSKAAAQAAKRSGNDYVTEAGSFFTRSGDLILTAVATRLN